MLVDVIVVIMVIMTVVMMVVCHALSGEVFEKEGAEHHIRPY